MLGRNWLLVFAAVIFLVASDLGAVLASGTLKIGRNEDSSTLDPIKTAQSVNVMINENVHATLVRFVRNAKEIEGELAESWACRTTN
ncbi:MAG: hypothetical protein AAF495_14140 [Pseudomonadota bacterium]